MSCFNKNEYKFLKNSAKEDNLIVFAVENYDSCNYNGVSVVFSSPRPGLRMVEVAVSYCSPEDEFKPKHGKYQALTKMYKNDSIVLPLGHLSLIEIRDTLTDMFLTP